MLGTDLVALKPGESYVMYGEHLWRVNGFYGDLKLLPRAKINSFIKLRSPNDSNIWSAEGHREWDAATQEETKPKHLSKGLVSHIKKRKEKSNAKT